MKHVLLTRFNLRPPGNWNVQEPLFLNEDWLRDRITWFDMVCAPSVGAQSCHDFTWLVFLHEATPSWAVGEVSRSASEAGGVVVRGDQQSAELFALATRQVAGGDPDWLTSRVDSDDALAKDYIERVQAWDGRGFLNLAEGLVLDVERQSLGRRRYPASPFMTLRSGEERTVFGIAHDRVNQSEHHLTELTGRPAWLQVVHGGNVSTSFEPTRLVGSKGVLERFGVRPDLLKEVDRNLASRQVRWALRRGLRVSRARIRRAMGPRS